jgi:hypothetical protein
MKELLLRWERAQMSWDDANSRAMQETVLDPLERKAHAAVIAMEKMMEVCAKARRDCG